MLLTLDQQLILRDFIKYFVSNKGYKSIGKIISDYHKLVRIRKMKLRDIRKLEREVRRRADYEAGLTDGELAERWGVAPKIVVRWRHERGLIENKRG